MERTLLTLLSREKFIPSNSKFLYIQSNYREIFSSVFRRLLNVNAGEGLSEVLSNLGHPSPNVYDFDNLKKEEIVELLNFLLARLSLRSLKTRESQNQRFEKFLKVIRGSSNSGGLCSKVNNNEKERSSDVAASIIGNLLGVGPAKDFNEFYNTAINKALQVVKTTQNQALVGTRLLPKYKHDDIVNLNSVNAVLSQEYTERKKLQAERLIVTMDSFMYSEKMESIKDVVQSELSSLRMILPVHTFIPLYCLFGSRMDLFYYEKTNGPSSRLYTRSKINKVKISDVPDRGGRALEKANVTETQSSFQRRQAPPSENTTVEYAMGTPSRAERSFNHDNRSSGPYGGRRQNFRGNSRGRGRRY